MKIKNLRHKDGSKLGSHELAILCDAIQSAEAVNGFDTTASVVNSSSISLSIGGACFRVIPERIGYNAKIYYQYAPATFKRGYKRTRVPLWSQRVEFNNILNSVLDRYDYVASIRSSGFTVRTVRDGARTEVDWWNDYANSGRCSSDPDCDYNGMFELIAQRLTEKEAINIVKQEDVS